MISECPRDWKEGFDALAKLGQQGWKLTCVNWTLYCRRPARRTQKRDDWLCVVKMATLQRGEGHRSWYIRCKPQQSPPTFKVRGAATYRMDLNIFFFEEANGAHWEAFGHFWICYRVLEAEPRSNMHGVTQGWPLLIHSAARNRWYGQSFAIRPGQGLSCGLW